MGAKRKVTDRHRHYENVVEFQPYNQKRQTVTILPRSKNQEEFVVSLLDNDKNIVFGIGPAGTGKTMLAVQAAIKQFKEGTVDKIIITRPAVSVDEELGYLPGTLEEKMAPWTRPMVDVLREYFTASAIQGMMLEGVIEIAPLAYMRGRTFKNAYIIADECQSTTASQMKMLLTRIGEGSKMVVTGDLEQADRGIDNGLFDFLQRIEKLNSKRIDVVRFDNTDVQRHPVIKDILNIYNF
jgi:phosphate starvation-inducible PhoH-like protein